MNAGECQGERMVVGTKCQGTTGECQGNLWEWVQRVRGTLGNTRECQGNVWVGVNCLGNRGNAGECQGNAWE